MAGRGGRRKGAGRKHGDKNRATLEKEQRVLDELRGKAARLTPQVWGKDELEDLIPRAKRLEAKVERLVEALMIRTEFALTRKNSKLAVLDTLRDWMGLLKEVQSTSSLIMARAGDFQSPKMSRVDGNLLVGMVMGAHSAEAPAAVTESKKRGNVVTIDDAASLARYYARMIQDAAPAA